MHSKSRAHLQCSLGIRPASSTDKNASIPNRDTPCRSRAFSSHSMPPPRWHDQHIPRVQYRFHALVPDIGKVVGEGRLKRPEVLCRHDGYGGSVFHVLSCKSVTITMWHHMRGCLRRREPNSLPSHDLCITVVIGILPVSAHLHHRTCGMSRTMRLASATPYPDIDRKSVLRIGRLIFH